MRKAKKYAEGGITINQQPAGQTQLPGLSGYNTGSNDLYPTRIGDNTSSGASSSGTNQTFNIQPQATAGQPQETVTTMKRGGKVSAASKRADGCAIRGKTRA